MSALPPDAPAWAWPLHPFGNNSGTNCRDAIARRPYPADGNIHLSSDVALTPTARLEAGRPFGVLTHNANSNQVRFGVGRRYYLPTAEDVALVRRLCPNLTDPENPNWLEIEVRLRAIGHNNLANLTPPELLALLDKAVAPAIPKDDALLALLRVFTNGVVDDRIEKAARLLANNNLTVDEKLTKIDALIPIPATASAKQLGDMLGVTRQAVMNTDWWNQYRKGERKSEIGRRREQYRKRGESYESPGRDDDE